MMRGMGLQKLLVANRGEIALRVLRAAAEMGTRTVAVFSADDANSLHTRRADEALALRGSGARAYLDAEQIVALARDAGCDAIHPGYGFLSENAGFAELCAQHGLVFAGPTPESLELFGDKIRARELAQRCDVRVLAGSRGPVELPAAREFLESLDGRPMMIKALSGGGGRGMRAVATPDEIEGAYARCQSEARAATGDDRVYVEELLVRARHIEVQLIGDGGAVSHVWDRDCTLQRRHQKIVELAPSPNLAAATRDALTAAAVRIGSAAQLRSLATVEFLLDTTREDDPAAFAFIEVNPRLQVEHTVTEQVTGIDLVQAQLQLAAGRSLADMGLLQADIPEPSGIAMQVRINMETMRADGTVAPTGGTLLAFEAPLGPGLRVDSFGYAGYATSPNYDSLLAKLIAHAPSGDLADLIRRMYRALAEFRIEGVATNVEFLQTLLQHPDIAASRVHTGFIAEQIESLVTRDRAHPRLFFGAQPAGAAEALAGARIDSSDPLAVLDHGREPAGASTLGAPGVDPRATQPDEGGVPEGALAVRAPVQGTVVSVDVSEGDAVRRGQPLLVMEAMKMEHVIAAPAGGQVHGLAVAPGDTVFEGHLLASITDANLGDEAEHVEVDVDLDHLRPDLAEVHDRHARGLDAARPKAVARRRKTGQRTARENIYDLCDADSFVEYGPLVIAAQRRRRTVEDLIENTPADGMLAGVGRVNGDLFSGRAAQCIAMSYDYTVLAGTQGAQNHRKKDRMFLLAEQWRLPIVFFTEGGGGRPGDTDGLGVAGLDCYAFSFFGKLSGLVPLVGINSGRCFAGNAALLGCCDVVIATRGSNIGMGGPAMIEGGGLGVFRPEEVGPMDVQVPNGVVDIAVEDEAEAVRVAKQYLSYFQGSLADWECADQRKLRGIIPENRLRIYDVREVIDTMADTGSVLELRREFGLGMITSLIRIEGRPIGVVANNPKHLAGAIDSNGADKAARFMQLCDAFDVPLLFLCDTPGIMVGPEVEKTALVRHAARMFVTGASVSVPFFTIVLRKGYGLGAQAMAGGSFKAPFFAVAWPTGEFGGMGLEGAVKLGYRKELAAIEEPEARRELFDEMVARMYRHGKAVNTASHFELDDVIDPLDSRHWITNALRSIPPREPTAGKKRPCIDTW
jgi:acetyl/propionyl-CoA carboxylase alpha subunit/acetyl-CoA carboxylase carboxyltransferase component